MFEPFIDKRVKRWRPTIRYLSQTEVHVYALAIGASVLLSFVPFLIVMLTLIRRFLPSAESALYLALHDVFPSDLGDFIVTNLRVNMNKLNHGRLQLTSVILLMFTANGVFEPLEVALNRAWGAKSNRSYLKNQLLSFFLIILCGGLALGSVILTAFNEKYVKAQFGLRDFPSWMPLLIFKIAAVPVTIVALFLTYWILPNCKVPVGRIFRVAVLVGLALEVLKYAFFQAWPWIDRKFTNEYSPFQHSASIMVLSMVASLIVLAGAEWSARKSEAEIPAADLEASA
ncbi:MAG: YihY/virulence factor BrkB family protein [Acidobacteriota bacterium]|nr:YihY/virulence factor BrkB family protein [Acidobacteriota bacterium]